MRTRHSVLSFALTFVVLLQWAWEIEGVCGEGYVSGRVVVRNSAGEVVSDASNFVVFVDNLKSSNPAPLSTRIPTVASLNKKFVPEVLPIVVGTTVEFPNEDIIFHNVFSLSKIKAFDLGLYGYGAGRRVKFDTPGLVKIYCNIHEKMVGHILVLKNPFFSVTNREGDFRIEGVPTGLHDLVAWSPSSDSQKKKVTVENLISSSNKTKQHSVQFEIQGNKVPVRHTNKWGLQYKENY